MKHIVSVCVLSAALLAGCMGYSQSYADRKSIFVVPDKKAEVAKQPCDMRGNIVSRSDKNCIGQVAKSPDGPTITVLTPGIAVPMADVDAASLEPPKR